MSVSISLVRALIEATDRAGIDTERFLTEGKLDRALLQNPNARLDAHTYDALQELALDMSADPAFGLHMGEHATWSAFQVVGYLVSQCRTIREALDVLFRYYRIVSDCQPSYLVERGDESVLIYNFLRTTPRCSRLRAEFGVTRLMRIANMFAGVSSKPRQVWFEHSEPPYVAEYARLFGEHTVLFDQPSTGIVMTTSALDSVQLHPNPNLYNVLKTLADRQLRELDANAPLSQRIHDLVVHHFTEVEPNMEMIGRHLDMSARTLRRKLAMEGRGFAEIVEHAMGELARNVVSEPNTTIQEAAFRLGFADVTSFHRAFKRWTGRTPKQFRQSGG
jgi:AraC-like DNA-binding protein